MREKEGREEKEINSSFFLKVKGGRKNETSFNFTNLHFLTLCSREVIQQFCMAFEQLKSSFLFKKERKKSSIFMWYAVLCCAMLLLVPISKLAKIWILKKISVPHLLSENNIKFMKIEIQRKKLGDAKQKKKLKWRKKWRKSSARIN